MKTIGLVIAVDGKLRNPRILEQIDQYFELDQLEVFKGITPLTAEPELLKDMKAKSRILLGRDVSDIEICITLSHFYAYQKALTENADILYVFEDDLNVDKNETPNLGRYLDKPRITLLYSPNWSIWVRFNKEWRALRTPAFAAGYVINNQALKIAVSNLPIGVADWPEWTKLSYFRLEESSGFSIIPDNRSFADEGREMSKSLKIQRAELKKGRKNPDIPYLKIFRFRYYDVFVWKIFNNFVNDKLVKVRLIKWISLKSACNFLKIKKI
jgi:hypothetical protein